jgi:nucleoside-diphosphate-sugar epimerase
MKILITGASSFTGYWFIKELAERGHTLTAIVRGARDQYTGLRKDRMEQVAQWAEIVWNCSFGDEAFLRLLDNGYDAICHHGAQVENYKSPDFDIATALQGNTYNARKVMEKIKTAGIRKFVVTGSVFEANEGLGDPPLVAFSPYGLSKTISWEVFRYWSWKLSIPLTKFVIPNPFGPYEEPRFCNYLVQTWKKGEVPAIQTPDYIRDNIHADLLARHYAAAVERDAAPGNKTGIEKYGPSGYIESQGAFAVRFAREMDQRLPLHCEVRLGKQVAFDEPMIRTNDILPDGTVTAGRIADWNEQQAWDDLAAYYKNMLLK